MSFETKKLFINKDANANSDYYIDVSGNVNFDGSIYINDSVWTPGGMDWSDPVDSNIVPTSDYAFDLGSSTNMFKKVYTRLGLYTTNDESYLSNSKGLLGNYIFSTGIGVDSIATFNIIIGDRVSESDGVVTGNRNTMIGTQAGHSNLTGNNNVFLGTQAGYNNQDGSLNIFIGAFAGRNSTGSNKLYIANTDTTSPLIYGDFDASLLKINGHLEVDGSINIDGSIYQNNVLFSPGLGGDVNWESGEYGNNNSIITANGDGSIVAESDLSFSGTYLNLTSSIYNTQISIGTSGKTIYSLTETGGVGWESGLEWRSFGITEKINIYARGNSNNVVDKLVISTEDSINGKLATFNQSGSVEFFFNNTKKIETTSSTTLIYDGLDVSSGNLSVQNYQYMGIKNTTGSWRFYITPDASADMVFEKWNGSAYVEKQRIF